MAPGSIPGAAFFLRVAAPPGGEELFAAKNLQPDPAVTGLNISVQT